jgi:hypothetical protein
MSEPLENRSDNVPGTKNSYVSCARQGGDRDLLPHLSLILDFVTQVEDHLPILSSEVLISRFRYSKM